MWMWDTHLKTWQEACHSIGMRAVGDWTVLWLPESSVGWARNGVHVQEPPPKAV